MNTSLAEALAQAVLSLSPEERHYFDQILTQEKHPIDPCPKGPLARTEPSTQEIMQLAQVGGSFDFLYDEADLYSLEDGEPV